MPVILKNNAVGYVSTTVNAADIGIVLNAGNGAAFPVLSAGE